MKVPGYLVPVLVGLVVLNIGIAFGYNCGYAINPARDFAPRLFTLMAGFGTETFRFVLYSVYIAYLFTVTPGYNELFRTMGKCLL